MAYDKRPYGGPSDLRAMQDVVQEVWSLRARNHIGDLAWGRFSLPGREAEWPTMLWYEGERLMGWGWTYQPGTLRLMTRGPVQGMAPEDLAGEILAWFEEVAQSPVLMTEVLDHEEHLISALQRAGYHEDREAPHALHLRCSLDQLPEPALPKGYRLRSMASGVSLAERAGAHRDAWTLLPFFNGGREQNVTVRSRVDETAYEVLINAWPYRRELDWVVEAPDGSLAACCIIWLDEVNKVAELEPVGTHGNFRRKGLGAAVCLAAMKAAANLGAETAIVYPRGDEAYPVPKRLYEKIGFQAYARTIPFVKSR